MEVCKKQCCNEQKCDVALVAKQVCYLVSCDNEVLCRPVLAKSTDLHPQIAYITRTVSSIGKMNITSKITQGLHSFQNYISFPKRPKYKDLYQNYGFIQRLSNDSIRKVKALVGAAGEDDGLSRDPITNVNPKINSKPISKAEQFFQQQDALIFPINKAKNASYSNTNIAAPLNCEPTRIYKKVSLKDGSDSGDFYDYGKVEKMQLCVELCCKDEVCDIAFMVGKTCYAIKCHDLLKCQIVSASKTTMVDTQLAYVVKKSNLHHRQVMQTVHNNERAFHIEKHKEEYRGLFDQTRMLLDERKKQNQKESLEALQYNLIEEPNVPIHLMRNCHHNKIMYNHALIGGQRAGIYTFRGSTPGFKDCLSLCCADLFCDAALLLGKHCYSVQCYKDGKCAGHQASTHSITSVLAFIERPDRVPTSESKYINSMFQF